MTAPAEQSVADRVRAQLAGDYPPGALSWVSGLEWSGPVRIPLSQIDRNAGDWSAADDNRKVAAFAKRITAGWRKPVVAIRRPGTRLVYLVDGHTRAAACAQIGQPVTAYVGTASTATGPWMRTHQRQLAGDGAALEMSAAGYPSGVVGRRSGMISLDIPEGTIKPVPGGVTGHHVTVVFLGDDVDDQAFEQACQRAKSAAAAVSGPLAATIGGIDSFPPSGSSDGKRPAFAPVRVPGAAPIRSALEDLSASEHKDWKPHATMAYIGKDDALPPPVPATPVRFTHLSVHRGDDTRRFPLGGAATELSAQTPVLSTVHHPLGSPTGPGLFRVKGLQLPAYIQNIAAALEQNGHPESRAIQLAIGACQRWARGGASVSPEVRAAAAKALAEWERAKATAHAHASDGEDAMTVELAGAFNSALHPRVGAGNAGGGRFAPKNSGTTQAAGKQPAAAKGTHRATPPHALTGRRAQARQFREKASALRAQADILDRQAHALALAHPTSKAASTSAKKAATAKARKNLPVKHKTKTSASKKKSKPSVASRITSLRTRAKILRTRASILDVRARELGFAADATLMMRSIELVGPKGYEHGWKFVGVPGVGAKVLHPGLGTGTVTRHDGSGVTVKFDGGGERTYARGHSKGAGRIEKAASESAAPAASGKLADAAVMDKARLRGMSGEHLKAVDAELSRRASLLGKPGKLSGTHKAVRAELARRSGTPKAKAAAPKTAEPRAAASAPPAKSLAGYQEWREGLTPAEDKAMRFYQSPGFALMNGQLRGLDAGKLKSGEHATDADLKRARQASKDLTKAIAKAPPLSRDTTVYRGFDASQFGKLTPGQVITDKGFTSTAITNDAGAVGRAGSRGQSEILLPAGTRAAAGSSRELVLPPGSSFRVVSVRTAGGTTHLKLELIPQGQQHANDGSAINLAVKTPPAERAAGRRQLAAKGQALPDGTDPVPNLDYLKRAIKSVGRVDPAKRPALKALIRKRAKELGALNTPGVKGTWAFQGANDGDAVELAMLTRTPRVRGAADVQMSRTAPGKVTVMHKPTGMKVGTLTKGTGGWTARHSTGKSMDPAPSMAASLSGLIGMHNRIAKSVPSMAPAGAKSMANGEQMALDLAGTLPHSTPAVSASDGPRVTKMGAAKTKGKSAPAAASMSAEVQKVYAKLIKKGMKPDAAMALAKRAAAMHAKAAAKAA